MRYSERPELWESISELSAEVWPEYNLHGETLNYYWAQLYDVFPDWQFVLCDPGDGTVLAEGHTIPVSWDGTDSGLGPGIDATIAAGFGLRAAGGQPTAVCALAAEIPLLHRGRHLSGVLLQAMSADQQNGYIALQRKEFESGQDFPTRSHHQFSGVPYHHLVGKAYDAARLGQEFVEELPEDRVV